MKQHKEQWLNICNKRPDILLHGLGHVDSGVLSAVISELEFNSIGTVFQIPFETREFYNAISNGILSLLDDNIKKEIMNVYVVIKSVNESIKTYNQMEMEKRPQFVLNTAKSELKEDIKTTKEAIDNTISLLQRALKEGS